MSNGMDRKPELAENPLYWQVILSRKWERDITPLRGIWQCLELIWVVPSRGGVLLAGSG